MPVVRNIQCYVNESPAITVEVTGTNFTSIPLKMGARASGSSTDLDSWTTGGGQITGIDGSFTVTIPLSDVAGLGVGVFDYYIQRTDSGAEADFVVGQWTIKSLNP